VGDFPIVLHEPRPNHLRVRLFREMLLARRVEERIKALYPQGDMRCPTHFSIGQEAVAAGVCTALNDGDFVVSAHRSHAHYINRGGNLNAMFAELYGKESGCASGKGGSMHLVDLAVNFLGCVPIVGSTIPIGVGASFGLQMQNSDAVVAIFFGDGATETGAFHESLNFAATRKLRVLFVCENNLYSVNTPLDERQPAGREIVGLAQSHGMPVYTGDGQTVETVHAASAEMLQRIRRDGGPGFVEFSTYRWLEHCGPNEDVPLGYRPKEDHERWLARCPIELHSELLRTDGILDAMQRQMLVDEIDKEIDQAVAFARGSSFPAREALFQHVYAGP